MGATNCPETPRQRMIGMMYLVLTAMLALNVSKEILNAFVTVNETVEKTNTNFEDKLGTTYGLFAKAADAEPKKAEEPYKKALEIQKKSKELVEYVEDIKVELYSVVDGMPMDEVRTQKKTLGDLSAKDNISKPTQYFVTQNKKAYEMAEKFKKYKQDMVTIVDDSAYTLNNPILATGLTVDAKYPGSKKGATMVDWESYNFEGTVAAACYTLLNKTIGEIRNMEFETVNYLYTKIDAETHKFSDVEAKVIPNSRIVFSGDKYTADIIVAAYDKRQNPKVYWRQGLDTATENMLGSLTAIEGKEGIVRLEIPTSAVGNQKFAGLIELVGPDGAQYFGFKSSYTVTKPAAAVAAEKMNVFYAGIPNPVAIAAPVAPEQLRISWGGASAKTTGAGKYDVDVPASLVGKEITISVSAEMEKGKTQNMGNTVFRVKAVPEPNVFIGGNITGGKQAKDAIMANTFVSARMGVDFNYELKWTVLSYKVTFVKNGVEDAPITVNGAAFSDQVKSKIQSASSGTIVEFSEIRIQSIAGNRSIPRTLTIRIR